MGAVHGAETQLTMSLPLEVAVRGPEAQLHLLLGWKLLSIHAVKS